MSYRWIGDNDHMKLALDKVYTKRQMRIMHIFLFWKFIHEIRIDKETFEPEAATARQS